MSIGDLWYKYRDVVLYVFFGMCTTLVNTVCYWFFAHILRQGVMLSMVIAWVFAVLFAYLTNRKWVFHSETNTSEAFIKESISFFGCRLVTGVLDWAFMYILVIRFSCNDTLIKAIANILIIILNYMASKFVIFTHKDKQGGMRYKFYEKIKLAGKAECDSTREYIENMSALFFSAILSFFVSIQSPIHLWKKGDIYTDSSVFKTISLMMDKGYIPYRDSFDHKGPLTYIINWIGDQISSYRGIWVIEIIFLTVTFYMMYKISRIYCEKVAAYVVVLTASSLLFTYFQGGNFTEEYAMPFIATAIYIFTDYFKNNRVNRIRILICGATFAGTLLLRPNMIVVWIVMCIAILYKLIVGKEIKQLVLYIAIFTIGAAIIILPIFIWLIANNAFGQMILDYIVFNKEYVKTNGTNAAKWDAFIYFFNTSVNIMAVIIQAYLCKKCKSLCNISYMIYMLITMLSISLSGLPYGHYGMIMIPMLVYPLANAFNMIEKITEQASKTVLNAFVSILLITFIILPDWCDLVKDIPSIHSIKNESQISSVVLDVTNELNKLGIGSDERITVYGNWDIIYVVSERPHATRYSYQPSYGTIIEIYISQLEKELPRAVVIQANRYDDAIGAYLDRNKYSLVYSEKGSFDKTGAMVFYRE